MYNMDSYIPTVATATALPMCYRPVKEEPDDVYVPNGYFPTDQQEVKEEEASNSHIISPYFKGLKDSTNNDFQSFMEYSRCFHDEFFKEGALLTREEDMKEMSMRYSLPQGFPDERLLNKKFKSKKNKRGKSDLPKSPRKKIDRFDGVSEEEVARKTLPDHLDYQLDIIIVGINPGLYAAHKGHHYAGPGNHFWKCLYLSGMVPEPYSAEDDETMLKFGIGFTNMVERATKGSADLNRKEIQEGAQVLITKLRNYQPKIAVFNGKGIYEVFSNRKDFLFGKQPEMIPGTNTHIWVMPSSSARCAQLPRAADKVPFYEALKKFRDHLNGKNPNLTEEEVVFSNVKLASYRITKIKPEDAVAVQQPEIKPEIKQEVKAEPE